MSLEYVFEKINNFNRHIFHTLYEFVKEMRPLKQEKIRISFLFKAAKEAK